MQPEFRPDENKALLPWREYHFSGAQIAAATLGWVALVLGAAFIDGGDPLYHMAAAVIVGALLLAVFLSHRDWATSEAVALDSAGIVAPTGWGRVYVRWTKLRAIAHVHSMMTGRILSLIQFNLVVFPKRGLPRRLLLPNLSAEERHHLLDILGKIARLHDIELIIDHTPEGQRALKRLPWFWF